MKIIVEINEPENRKTIEKINKTESSLIHILKIFDPQFFCPGPKYT